MTTDHFPRAASKRLCTRPSPPGDARTADPEAEVARLASLVAMSTSGSAHVHVPTGADSRCLLGVTRVLLHHAFSYAPLLDLAGVFAASKSLAATVRAYLRVAPSVSIGFRGRASKPTSPAFSGANRVMFALLCGEARSLVDVHIGDEVPYSVAHGPARVAQMVRRCARTLATPRVADAFFSDALYDALADCPRLQHLYVPASIHNVPDLFVSIARRLSTLVHIRTLDMPLCTWHDSPEPTVSPILKHLPEHVMRFTTTVLTHLPPGRVTTIVLGGIASDVRHLARFTETRNLTTGWVGFYSPLDAALFRRALTSMSRLERLTIGLVHLPTDDDGNELRLPPSLTALDIYTSAGGHRHAVAIDAPGLLEFTSRQYTDMGVACVLRGAPLLRSIRCDAVCLGEPGWGHVRAALCARSPHENENLREFAVGRCDFGARDTAVRDMLDRMPRVEAFRISCRDCQPGLPLEVLLAHPQLSRLELDLHGSLSLAEMRNVASAARVQRAPTRPADPAASPPPTGRQVSLPPVAREPLLRVLHIGVAGPEMLDALGAAGVCVGVTRLVVDDLGCADVDPTMIFRNFPALESCRVRLQRAPAACAHPAPSGLAAPLAVPLAAHMASRLAELELTYVQGDFLHLLPGIAAWCGGMRRLTLVGPSKSIACAPAGFARHLELMPELSLLRLCSCVDYPSITVAECRKLEQARPGLAVHLCRHADYSLGRTDVCSWAA